jgi:Leucine-rich repeat (LRR) protein
VPPAAGNELQRGSAPHSLPCLFTHFKSLWPHMHRVLSACSTPFYPLCIRFVLTCVCRHFGNNLLNGTLPATLSRLRSLTEFKCGVNNLDGKIPSLKEFASVHELEFGPNKFTGAFPAEMVELTSLVAFVVSKNALTGTLPSNFNKLQKLERFVASSNQLSSTLPESLASLPKLQELDLSSNYLTGVVHREFVSNVAARPGW